MSVHPHMRGEYANFILIMTHAHGSPPHAWGIRLSSPDRGLLERFTPTCVGNTSGKLLGNQYRRFTPTCVGNTCLLQCQGRRYPVHPHMRGEYMYSSLSPRRQDGSPPHAWGIHNNKPGEARMLRFTPTCVGNTV